jgi:hypothetical protein
MAVSNDEKKFNLVQEKRVAASKLYDAGLKLDEACAEEIKECLRIQQKYLMSADAQENM